jgi:hypothetical protein
MFVRAAIYLSLRAFETQTKHPSVLLPCVSTPGRTAVATSTRTMARASPFAQVSFCACTSPAREYLAALSPSTSAPAKVRSFQGGRRCGSKASAGRRGPGRLHRQRSSTHSSSGAAPGSQQFQSHPLLRISFSTNSAGPGGRLSAIPTRRRQYHFVSFRSEPDNGIQSFHRTGS